MIDREEVLMALTTGYDLLVEYRITKDYSNWIVADEYAKRGFIANLIQTIKPDGEINASINHVTRIVSIDLL